MGDVSEAVGEAVVEASGEQRLLPSGFDEAEEVVPKCRFVLRGGPLCGRELFGGEQGLWHVAAPMQMASFRWPWGLDVKLCVALPGRESPLPCLDLRRSGTAKQGLEGLSQLAAARIQSGGELNRGGQNVKSFSIKLQFHCGSGVA